MSRFSRGLAVALGIVAAPSVASAQLGLVWLDVRNPKPPVAVTADGRAQLVYELRLTNVARREYTLEQVEVLAGSTSLKRWSGDELKEIAVRMGEGGPTVDARIVPPGRQTLLYLLVTATPGSVPRQLDHRFVISHSDSGTVVKDTLTGYQVPVDPTKPPVIRSPLAGGPWMAANGPGNTSGHRRTVIAIDGQARIPQRFATDWVMLGADGRLWQGDSTKNETWYGYRQPVHAVAAATVVEVKDGIPENVPLAPNRAVPITLETVGGNHVILDLGGGFFAFYAHLIPGSIKVKVGDKVTVGQVIGSLGNSGNSDAPHLHFHVGDRPSPLGTEGLPFTLDEYSKLGVAPGFTGDSWKATVAPETRRGETPLENHVVRFKP